MNIISTVYQNVEYIYYIDESTANGKYIYSVLGVPIKQWNHIFRRLQDFRQYINREYGIQLYKELHATKFVNGRGSFSKTVGKFQRSEIFKLCLRTLAHESNTGIHTFSSISDSQIKSLDCVASRINSIAILNDYYALTFFDSGDNISTYKALRKMRAFNHEPKHYINWDDESYERNAPISRIVADAMFIDSSTDYMIQAVDFIAYAVKTMYEPSVNASKYNLQDSYKLLAPIIQKQATKQSKLGIIEQ